MSPSLVLSLRSASGSRPAARQGFVLLTMSRYGVYVTASELGDDLVVAADATRRLRKDGGRIGSALVLARASEAPSSSAHERRSLNAATRAGVRIELARCRRHGLGGLPYVDVDDFDGVVAVAQPVPDGDFRLDVSGGIGGTCAEALAPRFCGFPFEAPVLPLVRTFARF